MTGNGVAGMTGEMGLGAAERGCAGVGCCARRDTRGERGYDESGGAGVTQWGHGMAEVLGAGWWWEWARGSWGASGSIAIQRLGSVGCGPMRGLGRGGAEVWSEP